MPRMLVISYCCKVEVIVRSLSVWVVVNWYPPHHNRGFGIDGLHGSRVLNGRPRCLSLAVGHLSRQRKLRFLKSWLLGDLAELGARRHNVSSLILTQLYRLRAWR